MKRLAIILALVGGPVGADSPFEYWMNGNELLDLCDKPSGQDTLCLGYVIGIIDGVNNGAALEKNAHHALCTAENATRGQLADIVVKHLQSYPETRHLSAAKHVRTAVKMAFDCNDSRATPASIIEMLEATGRDKPTYTPEELLKDPD